MHMTNSTESKKYVRPLSMHERKFLASPSSYISLAVRVKGEIKPDDCQRAIEKVVTTYPILKARIELQDDKYAITTDSSIGVDFTKYQRVDADSWFNALVEETERLTDITEGHLAKFILVQNTEVSEICVCINHSISDGMSLVFVMNELLQHLDNPYLDSTPPIISPPADPEIFPEGTSVGRIAKWYLDRINKKWQDEKIVFDQQDRLDLWQGFWEDYDFKLVTIELTKEQTTSFIEVCRRENVTVNSTLLIAIYHARELVWEKLGKEGATIASAVNTRKLLRADLDNAVGLYAGGVIMKYKYEEGTIFWDNVRKFHKVMTKALKKADVYSIIMQQGFIDPTLVDAMLFYVLGGVVKPHQSRYQKISEFASSKDGLVPKFMKSYAKGLTDQIITNLGRIDIPDSIGNFPVERAFFNPGAGFKAIAPLGVVTAGGCLTINLNYFEQTHSTEKMKKLTDKTKEIILNLISE